jgi:FtsP/CotA-like multicopper oxidase with cupredoxin domain
MRQRLIALELSLVCVFGMSCDDSDDTTSSGSSANTAAQEWEHSEGLTFKEPDEIRGRDGVVDVQLESRERDVQISGGEVRGTVYNDAFVGPTLRVSPGESLHVNLLNGLTQHTNIHYHGMHVSPEGDSDNIFLMIDPGDSHDYTVDVPADHDVGTFWYHSHMHMDSESQVFGGLSGVLIVDGLENLLPEEYRDIEQHVFALKDLQVKDGAIVADNIDSNAPTVRTVNGLVEPKLTIRPGETQLWRLANISADIYYNAGFAAQPFVVIAEDGNPVERPWTAYNLIMPPGKRFDVIVRAPRDTGDYTLETVSYNQGGDHYPRSTLVRVDVRGTAMDELPPLTQGLVEPDNLLDAEIAEHREWTFTENDRNNTFAINGKSFDPNRVDVQPKLGTVEEWTIRNQTSEQHPFHIHVNDFKVLSVNKVPYTSHGEQDTVVLPPHGEVVIRMAFLDFTGKFVFHCHILAHEDGGMMAVVDVVP